jgi:serine/threonine protein kinase
MGNICSTSQSTTTSKPSCVTFKSGYCSTEGCFLNQYMLQYNLDLFPENAVSQIEVLALGNTGSVKFIDFLTFKDLIIKNQWGIKVYYDEPRNKEMIEQLKESYGNDINIATTYVLTTVDSIQDVYGFKVIIDQNYIFDMNKRIIQDLYIVLQYPCRVDVFSLIQKGVYRNNQAVLPYVNHFVKHIEKLFEDLYKLHQNAFIHFDIKPENIVYCSGEDDFRFIDFSIGKVVDESKNYVTSSFHTYLLENSILDILSIHDFVYKNNLQVDPDLRNSTTILYITILQLNDIFCLLYTWCIAIDYKYAAQFINKKKFISVGLLQGLMTVIKTFPPSILTKIYVLLSILDTCIIYFKNSFYYSGVSTSIDSLEQLCNALKLVYPTYTNMIAPIPQQQPTQQQPTQQQTPVSNLPTGLTLPPPLLKMKRQRTSGGKDSKIQSFINTYHDTFFVSNIVKNKEALAKMIKENPILNVYRVNKVLSTTERKLELSRYKINLKTNPTFSLKNLKGQKEEGILSKGDNQTIQVKKYNDTLIPISTIYGN